MKKSLVGCEREFLVRGGGDERFWVQIESLSRFVGGLWLPKVAVVSFGFCMEDAIFKHGAGGWVIFDICWARRGAVRVAVSWLCFGVEVFLVAFLALGCMVPSRCPGISMSGKSPWFVRCLTGF